MKILTKAEEQIMQVIWKLNKAFLREIIDEISNPKPHNNTVATILKILVEKEFVGVTVYGRMHQYYPLISKDAYSKTTIRSLVKIYFKKEKGVLLCSVFTNETPSIFSAEYFFNKEKIK